MENNEVDPFAVPPLVEWENCVTHDELHQIQCGLMDAHKNTKWWKFREKLYIKLAVNAIAGLLIWVHNGKPTLSVKGVIDEKAN